MKSENKNIDVNELMAVVKQKAALRKEHQYHLHMQGEKEFQMGNVYNKNIFDTSTIKHYMSLAESEIDVGGQVTSMEHFHNRLIRKAATYSGRMILYLARFITAKQRRFNLHVVETLKTITHILDTSNEVFEQKNQELKSLLENYNKNIEKLQIVLNNHKEELIDLRDRLNKQKLSANQQNVIFKCELNKTFNDIEKISQELVELQNKLEINHQ